MFREGAVVRPLFAVVLGMMSVTIPLSAQDTAAAAAKTPLYDVVSIKPNKSGSGMMRVSTGGDAYSGTNISLKMMVQYAFRLQTPDQIAGLPGWADSAGFDVNAKMDSEAVAALKKLSNEDANEQRRLMMQAMLIDRFHLKVHHETREMQTYDLVVAKGGFKLKEADPNDTYPNGFKGPDGLSHAGMMMMGNGEFTAQAITMSNFVSNLSLQLHRNVLDKTELKGKYDITLKYSSDNMPAESADAAAGEPAPSLMTALQEQLGLKLESIKGPVDTIVVDHVEQPTEN